jgi:GT2 family glycosyltransferase
MRVSLIIPTFNGLALLQKHLPALLAAEGVADAELLVADDGSNDGTMEWLARHVPQARVVRSAENRGFSHACNAAIHQSLGDALLLLNNDVAVQPDFLPPLVEALQSSPDVFAVNSRILLPRQAMRDEGEKIGAFHHGIFYVDCLRQSSAATAPTLYATACSALYRRERVMALGGFDELFSPFYWEDVDLSYRALRRGWTVLYEPRSVVYHEHETTTSRVDPGYKMQIRERNQFLFVWKNMTDRGLTARSLMVGAAVALEHAARRHDRSLWNGYRAALRFWPQVRACRTVERREATVADRAILARFAAPTAPGNVS